MKINYLKNKLSIAFIIVTLLQFSYSCKVKRILNKSGENKVELRKFLSSHKNNSLKRQAAKFSVIGMEHCYSNNLLVKDSKNNLVDLNLYQPKTNRKIIVKLLDSLQYWVTATIVKDLVTVKSDYLEQNLEKAFEMWQTKPWSKNYSFEIFCEFILPHRIGSESLDDKWRTYFQNKYVPVLDTMPGNDDVNRIFQFVKRDLRKWCWYSGNTINLKQTMNLDDILSYHKGSCLDVANAYLYALRSIGVAATIDYVPLWGRTNFGHCELVYWDENNKTQMCKTGNYLGSQPPKVYRKYYSNDKNSLASKISSSEDIPQHLAEMTYRDVTSEYTRTSNVTIKADKQPKNGILYLSVFNSGRWQPIAWSDSIPKKTDQYVFKNMGRNIVYLPTQFSKRVNIPIADPIIIAKTGQIKTLTCNKDSLISLILPKKDNRLYYWNKKWISLGRGNRSRDSLTFENAPSNTLYRLLKPNGNPDGRIFTYENNKLTYW